MLLVIVFAVLYIITGSVSAALFLMLLTTPFIALLYIVVEIIKAALEK